MLFRVPRLSNSDIVIRVAQDPSEVQRANTLVFRNYVARGYWDGDRTAVDRNPYLHLPTRHVFVVMDGSALLGTASIIVDSPHGLPADSFQKEVAAQLRKRGETLAEISALAIDRYRPHPPNLMHFVVAFIFQYSFYYAAVDRFVIACTPRHAMFYERSYGFHSIHNADFYKYVNVEAQILTLNLIDSYESAKLRYRERCLPRSFFQFMYRDEHPNMHFPPCNRMRRSRKIEWTSYATQSLVAV
jgi:N-acyl amino acid synthase FeeM